MNETVETLKELHQLHSELADARSKLKHGPLQIRARAADLENKSKNLEIERGRLKQLRMEADEKELLLKTGEQKVGDLKVKLNTVKSNKEYSALKDEIDAVQKKNDSLEEEILETFSLIEEEIERLALHEKQLETASADYEKFKETTEYTLEKMEGRLGMLEDKRTELERALSGDIRELYKKLLQSKPGRDVLAGCIDTICQGCHTNVTPQDWNNLAMGRLVSCRACGAILYRAE